jgi:hydroxypyruvate reductase
MNAVRKHLSAIKGGRLAEAAWPARQLTIYVSDVPKGQDASVASGPTMPDDSTLDDLRRVVSAYRLEPQLPPPILSLLGDPTLPETPKPGDTFFARSDWVCALENRHAIDATTRLASGRGWRAEVDTTVDDIDVAEAADRLLARLERLRASAPDRPVCVVSGGELSSPVRGDGVGGRNQAFVLNCVERIDGERVAVLSAGTDGIDGNSPAAGAVADGSSLERARSLGLDPVDHDERSDSYTFFKRLGDDITCGATLNNVRDIRVLVSWP